jgi:molybdate transport system regulatory protein
MKLWLEIEGELVISAWRVQLLEAVAETGSLSEAANRLGVHFRIAWGKVREMEQRLGVKLVETHTGGVGGGGSRLTPAGVELVRKYRQLNEEVCAEVERRFSALFPAES